MSFCPEHRTARRPLNVQDLLGEPLRYDKLSSKDELDSKRHAEAGYPDKPKVAPVKPNPQAEQHERTQAKTAGPSARNEAIDKAQGDFSRGVGGLPGKLYGPIGNQLPMRVDDTIRTLSPVSLDPNASFEEQAGNLIGGVGAGKAIGAAGRALAPYADKAARAVGGKATDLADWLAKQRGQTVPSMAGGPNVANSDSINVGKILGESAEAAARRARASERAAKKGPQIGTGEPDPIPVNGSSGRFNPAEPPPIPPVKGRSSSRSAPSEGDLLNLPPEGGVQAAASAGQKSKSSLVNAAKWGLGLGAAGLTGLGTLGWTIDQADALQKRLTGESELSKAEAKRNARWGANEAAEKMRPNPAVEKKNADIDLDRKRMEAIKEFQRKQQGR
jgi:hypothetical protein